MPVTKRKQPVVRGCGLHDSHSATFWKRRSWGGGRNISGRRGDQEGKESRADTVHRVCRTMTTVCLTLCWTHVLVPLSKPVDVQHQEGALT